jgi:hypothetical protein
MTVPRRTRHYELVAAARMVENLAERIYQVQDHVRTELAYADSISDHVIGASDPEATPSKPMEGNCTTRVHLGEDVWHLCGRYRPCGDHDTPVTLTPVERAAERRLHLNRALSEFEDKCKDIVLLASQALRAGDDLIGTRLADERKGENVTSQCRDGQFGKEGAIEWSDPTCEDDAVKCNLCMKHYWVWYRWRKEHGKRTPEIAEYGEDVA